MQSADDRLQQGAPESRAAIGRVAFRSAWPALVAGGLALALYALTLAPGLTWAHDGADGGDLLTAALTYGVPHPTGYPTYVLLLAAAVRLTPDDPALGGNWLSAISAALAVALLSDLARRTLAGQPWQNIAALAAGLIFATSPDLWSQAVITEVYASNALAVMALLWLMWRWREATAAGRRAWPWLSAAGLVFGLGLGNHLTLALMLPGLIAWVWPLRRAIVRQESWQHACLPLATCALGLMTYTYLPWAASRVAPVNWGDPSSPERFVWLVSGAVYRDLVFGVPSDYLPIRLIAWGHRVGWQFGGGLWGVLIAALGLWRLKRTTRSWWWTTLLVALAYTAYAINYNTTDSYVYLIPAWAMACLWIAHGLAWIAQRLAMRRGRRWAVASLIALAVVLPTAATGRHALEMDLSDDSDARGFIESALANAPPGAVILVAEDRLTFALWYARYGLQQRPDIIPVNVHLYDERWYQASLLRYHPALAVIASDGRLPPLEDFFVEAEQRWSLYRAGPLDSVMVEWSHEPRGILVRLTTPSGR